MKAILNKTVGPNFKAGDVIKGDYTRINNLVQSGIATADNSYMNMAGCIVTWVMSAIIFMIGIASFWAHEIDGFWVSYLSPLWRWTFIILPIIMVFMTITQFTNANIPYTLYFLSFATNIVGGILIMAGHEKATSRYQEKRTSSMAAIILFTTGAIAFSIAFISILNWNIKWFNNMDVHHFVVWVIWFAVICFGSSMAKFFDKDFQNRRKRFIGFLQKKNATIEYKTKALNYWRAYKATGNSDKFMEKNIELLEETLDIDRQQVVGNKKTKK